MRNTINKPKHFSILDILAILLAGILALTFTSSFRAIGELDDWYYYDEFVRIKASQVSSEEQHSSYLPFFEDSASNESGIQNISDADSETIGLVNEAKQLLYAQFGDQPALLWNHFDDLQVKACEVGGSIISGFTVALYKPDENTIYCNKRLLFSSGDYTARLHILTHELTHALLEQDESCIENNTNLFHEGFTEYLAQLACPTTDNPSYFMSYCIAEVFVKDNGLDKAIELFMSGKAEASINQRLHKENALQNINGVLLTTAVAPIAEFATEIILDVYLHYVRITGVDVHESIELALKRVSSSYDNLAAKYYFDELLNRRDFTIAAFSWR